MEVLSLVKLTKGRAKICLAGGTDLVLYKNGKYKLGEYSEGLWHCTASDEDGLPPVTDGEEPFTLFLSEHVYFNYKGYIPEDCVIIERPEEKSFSINPTMPEPFSFTSGSGIVFYLGGA